MSNNLRQIKRNKAESMGLERTYGGNKQVLYHSTINLLDRSFVTNSALMKKVQKSINEELLLGGDANVREDNRKN